MSKLKKVLRLLGLCLLILLACCGIGIVGGVPLPRLANRKDRTELIAEEQEEASEDTFKLEVIG